MVDLSVFLEIVIITQSCEIFVCVRFYAPGINVFFVLQMYFNQSMFNPIIWHFMNFTLLYNNKKEFYLYSIFLGRRCLSKCSATDFFWQNYIESPTTVLPHPTGTATSPFSKGFFNNFIVHYAFLPIWFNHFQKKKPQYNKFKNTQTKIGG